MPGDVGHREPGIGGHRAHGDLQQWLSDHHLEVVDVAVDALPGRFTSGGQAFNITHVVTAGSPIGRTDIPADVQVLSLENQRDIVPHLDAAPNPDRFRLRRAR